MQPLQNRLLLVMAFIVYCGKLTAQDTLTLSRDEFINIVKAYHPLAKKYQLQNDIATNEITRARGNFDPQLAGKLGEKNVDAIRYYQQQNATLEIPTWYGIDLNAGFNQYQGDKLNNSETKGELYQFGVNVPLANGLWYDKRRAAVQQARIASRMTEAEQIVLVNQLLLDAENVYWEWVKNYQVYQLQVNAVAINQGRLALTRQSFAYGEHPAIDTVEVLSQLQNFQLQAQDAALQFVKATQELQWYLWNEDEDFYPITRPITPLDRLETQRFNDFMGLMQAVDTTAVIRHQSLRYYTFKQDFLERERRLKWQGFLPKLDFSYQFFNRDRFKTNEYLPLFDYNFQYGLKLEVPLFLRQARADYRIAQIKLQQNQQDQLAKERELITKLNTYKNEVLNMNEQINIARQNLANYRRLLAAEEMRYQNGESSLFLINSRENKLIEAQEKLLQLQAKFIGSYNKLRWFQLNLQQ